MNYEDYTYMLMTGYDEFKFEEVCLEKGEYETIVNKLTECGWTEKEIMTFIIEVGLSRIDMDPDEAAAVAEEIYDRYMED